MSLAVGGGRSGVGGIWSDLIWRSVDESVESSSWVGVDGGVVLLARKERKLATSSGGLKNLKFQNNALTYLLESRSGSIGLWAGSREKRRNKEHEQKKR